MKSSDTMMVYLREDPDPEKVFSFEKDLLSRTEWGQFSLLIYTWSHPLIILGYNQSADDRLISRAAFEHIPVVRRSTGGTGIVHHRDIGVSLALPMYHPWARSIGDLYRENRDIMAQILRGNGIETNGGSSVRNSPRSRSAVCFLNEGNDGLYFKGKRCTGSAQSRRHYGVLIHSHIHLSMRDDLYSAVFSVDLDDIRENMVSIPLSWDERERFIYAMITVFSNRLKMNPDLKKPSAWKRWIDPPSQLELHLHTISENTNNPRVTKTETCGVS